MVRTDHYILKFLLDQCLSTVPQHQWISKLSGFDFAVEYCPGRFNTVVDALSCRDVEDGAASGAAVHLLSTPTFALLDDIRTVTAVAGDT